MLLDSTFSFENWNIEYTVFMSIEFDLATLRHWLPNLEPNIYLKNLKYRPPVYLEYIVKYIKMTVIRN